MIAQRKSPTAIELRMKELLRHKERSSKMAQPVFVGTLLFIALSVAIEYTLGEFLGLNAGQDFGLVVGGTLVCGIIVGVLAGAVHDWIRHANKE